MKPYGDRILVRPDDSGDVVRDSGIVIPSSAAERPLQGTVVAVGEGPRSETGEFLGIPIEPGARVVYTKFGGSEVNVAGEILLVISMVDVLAVG